MNSSLPGDTVTLRLVPKVIAAMAYERWGMRLVVERAEPWLGSVRYRLRNETEEVHLGTRDGEIVYVDVRGGVRLSVRAGRLQNAVGVEYDCVVRPAGAGAGADKPAFDPETVRRIGLPFLARIRHAGA